jgi:hypothetical protein
VLYDGRTGFGVKSMFQVLRRFGPVACVLALGLMLAGCDKCGWLFRSEGAPEFCRDTAPAQK